MRTLKVTFVAVLFTLFSVAAHAQQEANVGQLVSGLITVNVGAVQADIDVSDVIDVNKVLNNNEVRILNNAINNNEILSRNQIDLTIDLRKANIITDNQIVVGVLSGGIIVVDEGVL